MSNVSKKKKTANYTPKNLELALKEIREDKKGIRETCRKYGIPRTTIQDRLIGKRTDELKNRGPEPILGSAGEKEVVQWIINLAKCGFPLKKQELLDTVQKILKDKQKCNPFKDDRPGQTWYTSFLKRNPEISLRSAESINKARARVTEESIRLWFRELENFLTREGQLEVLQQPNRIYNADESGFSLCPKSGKVIGPKGYRNLYQIKPGSEKDNLTVLVMFNASGQMCPPLVVFPYIRPPKAISDSMPPDWCLGRSETGWMKSDVFFEYITNDFNAWLEKNNIPKPILLLVDGHKSHMSLVLSSMCEELGIILYALPPNTTHMLQPADVSVFAPLKNNWRNVVRKFLAKPENINKSVTKINFCQLFKDTIEHPQMSSNIINGFRKCGLFPFNPDAVDFTKCVQNTIEQLNRPRNQEEITNQDLNSTRKVLRHLRPILKTKKVDVKLILKELKKLRSTEVRESQILYETGSEDRTDSTVHLSASLTAEEININNLNNSIETHFSGQSGDQLMLSQGKIATNADLDIPVEVDVINVHGSFFPNLQLENQAAHDNIDETLSTFHISGSYLEQGSLVSLENVVIIPLETSTPSRPECQTSLAEGSHNNSSQAEAIQFKVPIAKVDSLPQRTAKIGDTTSNSTFISVSEKDLPVKSNFTLDGARYCQHEGSLLPLDDVVMPDSSEPPSFGPKTFSSQPNNSRQSTPLSQELYLDTGVIQSDSSVSQFNPKSTNPHDIFKKHLFVPQPFEKSKQTVTKPRLPAAISSRKWREFYEEKENVKIKKVEAVKRKQEESKIKKLEIQRAKKKKLKSRKSVQRNEQVLKECCAQCTDILNSDTEDDENKNIGCDFCTKWFHFKCTHFKGLTYDQAKDMPFKCTPCIVEQK